MSIIGTDRATMDRLGYIFCVFNETLPAQKCVSGKLSSLSTQNRTFVMRTLLWDKEQTSNGTKDVQEDFVCVPKLDIRNNTEAFYTSSIAILLFMVLTGVIVLFIRILKKKWGENAIMTNPNKDIEPVLELTVASKSQKSNLNVFADHSSNENEETILLLPHITVSKESFSSEETFNEYDAPSLSSSQEVYKDYTNKTNDKESKEEENSQSMVVSENTKSSGQTVSEKNARNKANTSVETVCEIVQSWKYKVERENTIHLSSQTKISNSKCKLEDETNMQVEIGGNVSGSDLDLRRYDWDQIFIFMIDNLIVVKEYRLFFIMLYGELGFEDPENKISLIEMETKCTSLRLTMLMLLRYWRKAVGVHGNPVDIEQAFEKIGWNSQLKDFKEYTSKLPLKEHRKTFHGLPDNSINSLLASNTMTMPVIMNSHEQLTDPATNIDFQTTEEYKIQRSSNGSVVIETVNIKRRRRKRPLNKNKDSDINEPMSKYKRVVKKADQLTIKNSNIRRNGKKCKNTVPMDESRISLPELSSSASSSTSAAEPTLLSVAATEATSSPEAQVTSGYASYFESSRESHFNTASSNSSTSETHTTVVNNSEESPKQKICLKNSLNDSSFPCQNENLTVTSSLTANKKISPSRNLVESLTLPVCKNKGGHFINAVNAVQCQATSSSWNVSSVEQAFSNSTLAGPKDKRRKSGKRKAETLDEYPSKKRQSMKVLEPKKKLRNLFRQNRILKRKDRRKTDLLIKHVETFLQNKLTVDRYEFDIFIKDIIQRLSMHPTGHDILSMRMQSYLNADSIVTHQNEKVRLVYCGKSFLVLREKEWTSLQIYVELARNDLLRKIQSNFNTDVIFLNYDGDLLQ